MNLAIVQKYTPGRVSGIRHKILMPLRVPNLAWMTAPDFTRSQKIWGLPRRGIRTLFWTTDRFAACSEFI